MASGKVPNRSLGQIVSGAWKGVLKNGFQPIQLVGPDPTQDLESLSRLEGWSFKHIDMSAESVEGAAFAPWTTCLKTLTVRPSELKVEHQENRHYLNGMLFPETLPLIAPPLMESLEFDREALIEDILLGISNKLLTPTALLVTNFQRIQYEGMQILTKLLETYGPSTPLLLLIHFDEKELPFFLKTRDFLEEYYTEKAIQGLVIEYSNDQPKLTPQGSYDPHQRLKQIQSCCANLASRQGLAMALDLSKNRRNRSLSPKERKDLQLQIALLQMQVKNYDEALLAFSEVNAEQEGPEFLMKMYFSLGELLLLKNRPGEAKPYVDHGEKLARDYSQDFWFPLYLYLRLLLSHKSLVQDYQLQDYYEMVQALERHKLHRQLLYALFSYPNEWDSQKSMKDSLWMVEKGIAFAEEKQDPYFLSVGCHRKGVLLAGLMGEEEAMDYYIKAVEVREPLEQPLPMVQILNGITYSYLNQGDFSSAFYYMRRALKILDKVEDFAEMGVTLFNLAMLYVFGRNFDKAAEVCQVILKMMQTLDMKRLPFNPQSHILLTLAFCRLRMNKIPEGLGSLLSAEKRKEEFSDHFQNLYHITKAWAAAHKQADASSISGHFEEALKVLPETKTFRTRACSFVHAEWAQALDFAGHKEESLAQWEKAHNLSQKEDWKGFKEWFHKKPQDFFYHRESFPSLPITLGIFSALFKQEKNLNSLFKRIQEIQFLNQSIAFFQNYKRKDEFAKKMSDYIAGNMTLQKAEIWEFYHGRWQQLGQSSLENQKKPAEPVEYSPDLISWLILNQTNQVLVPGASEYIPPELQALWDSLLVFPLQDGDKLLGVLLLTAQEGEAFQQQDAEILGILSNHIAAHILGIQRNEDLMRLSQQDPLTGLFNRNHLLSNVEEEIKRYKRYGGREKAFSLCAVDLDAFARFNESFGHIAGDYLMVWFSKLLGETFRETDKVYRYEEDCFMVLLPESPPDETEIAVKRLYTSLVEKEYFLPQLEKALGESLPRTKENEMSCSTGIAFFKAEDEISAQVLLHQAERALKKAKASGGSRYALWEEPVLE
jgi:diguanylate cyclase (GGDEF)-like protein